MCMNRMFIFTVWIITVKYGTVVYVCHLHCLYIIYIKNYKLQRSAKDMEVTTTKKVWTFKQVVNNQTK